MRSGAVTLREPDEVAALAPEWQELLAESGCNRAFSSPAWYCALLRSDPEMRPHVIAVRRGGRLAAVLPLVRTRDAEGRPELAFADKALTDYNDAVVRRGDEAAVRAALDSLAATLAEEGILCRLANLRDDSSCWTALERMAAEELLAVRRTREEVCLFADLSGGWEAYVQGRAPSLRHRVRRSRSRAARLGIATRVVGAASPAREREEVADLFLALHLERFRVLGGSSSFAPPARQRVLREAFPHLLAQGALRAYLLLLAGQVVCADLHVVGARALGGWSSGFTEEAAAVSPGTFVTARAIEDAGRDGFTEYDLLRGVYRYKEPWVTGARRLLHVTVEPMRGAAPPRS